MIYDRGELVLKYKFVIMFMIILCGTISVAVFNPIIGLLSRELGLSEIQSGCLVSVTGLCWLLGGFFWEKTTFMSRKRMLAFIMFVYLATLLLFALLADYAGTHRNGSSGFFWIFLLLRAIAGFFFGGFLSKAQAYVMSWTTQETRTQGMAIFGAANGLGFILGPAMSGGMAAIGLTSPMYAAAALLFMMIILLWISIPNDAVQKKDQFAPSLSPFDVRIRFFLWTGLLLSLTINILQVTIGFYVQDSFGYEAREATQLIGLGLAICGSMVVVTQIVISKYLKWRPERMLRLGMWIVVLGLLGLLSFIRYAYLDFAILGIGFGLTWLGYSAGAADAVQDHEQRSVASYIATLLGGGAFLGPITGTALYTAHMAVPYSFCTLLFGLSLLIILSKKKVAFTSMRRESHDK